MADFISRVKAAERVACMPPEQAATSSGHTVAVIGPHPGPDADPALLFIWLYHPSGKARATFSALNETGAVAGLIGLAKELDEDCIVRVAQPIRRT